MHAGHAFIRRADDQRGLGQLQDRLALDRR
jgi:hypothetical protein